MKVPVMLVNRVRLAWTKATDGTLPVMIVVGLSEFVAETNSLVAIVLTVSVPLAAEARLLLVSFTFASNLAAVLN